MYSREYIYIRKTVVDQDQRVMLLMSHAVDHPATPLNPKYVRVNTYKSNMVIKPHSSFDEVSCLSGAFTLNSFTLGDTIKNRHINNQEAFSM